MARLPGEYQRARCLLSVVTASARLSRIGGAVPRIHQLISLAERGLDAHGRRSSRALDATGAVGEEAGN
jgi:hypothetical protein